MSPSLEGFVSLGYREMMQLVCKQTLYYINQGKHIYTAKVSWNSPWNFKQSDHFFPRVAGYISARTKTHVEYFLFTLSFQCGYSSQNLHTYGCVHHKIKQLHGAEQAWRILNATSPKSIWHRHQNLQTIKSLLIATWDWLPRDQLLIFLGYRCHQCLSSWPVSRTINSTI